MLIVCCSLSVVCLFVGCVFAGSLSLVRCWFMFVCCLFACLVVCLFVRLFVCCALKAVRWLLFVVVACCCKLFLVSC